MADVCIVVPVYNVENYIRRCVDSILSQTFSDFELILVDDGSPDRCGAICDAYAEKDSRITVIHQQNGGLSAARNAGIDWAFVNSSSEWITFIDSDDWIAPQYLEAMYRATVQQKADLVICGHIRISEECDFPEKTEKPTIIDAETFYCDNHVAATVAWGKLYQRNQFQQFRYPVGKIHEDEYITYRILFEAKRASYISTPLYFYFINAVGIMGDSWNIKRLDALPGLEAQAMYLRNTKNQKAYQFAVNNYTEYLSYDLRKLNEKGADESRMSAVLVRKLRRILLSKERNALQPETMKEAKKMAFPVLTKLKKKLRKKTRALQDCVKKALKK